MCADMSVRRCTYHLALRSEIEAKAKRLPDPAVLGIRNLKKNSSACSVMSRAAYHCTLLALAEVAG